ncbi:Uncharacterized protein APZ42_032995 [Daphnia magna]|uniref:Uncharacterized protein n=1 Tax=Daphnia magna TaxID=35525 RepID=A0A164LIN6_9CRUS|nr:Uncharacterized protein APZ42_032995 [Daphnia magna]
MLRSKLTKLVLDITEELRDGILLRLEERFVYSFDLDDYILVSVSHPAFKFGWLKRFKSRFKSIF